MKKDAVLSVFEFPEHIMTKAAKERHPINRNAPAEKSLYSGAWSPKQPKLCDHTYASKVSAKNVKAQYQQILSRKIRIIQNLHRKSIRQENTVKGLMQKLQQAELLSEQSTEALVSNLGHMTREIFKHILIFCQKCQIFGLNQSTLNHIQFL